MIRDHGAAWTSEVVEAEIGELGRRRGRPCRANVSDGTKHRRTANGPKRALEPLNQGYRQLEKESRRLASVQKKEDKKHGGCRNSALRVSSPLPRSSDDPGFPIFTGVVWPKPVMAAHSSVFFGLAETSIAKRERLSARCGLSDDGPFEAKGLLLFAKMGSTPR